jgi:hypothetical protein
VSTLRVALFIAKARAPGHPLLKKTDLYISFPQTQGVIMAYDVREYIRKYLIQKEK